MVDYYDDENMMTIVDYAVPRTAEDINHPNVDKSIMLPAQPVKRTEEVIEESVFVTTRQGPLRLKAGEQLDVLNVIEGGELVSIEVVTDNPYLATFLELDDYRNKEPVGITAAELLMRGRDEFSEREFYVEDRRPDGMYVVKYHPRRPDVYKDRIKIQLRNEIRKTNQVFGQIENQTYRSRGGLPSPQNLGFLGGSFIKDPLIGAREAMEDNHIEDIIARPVNSEPYNVSIPNQAAMADALLDLGVLHPFVGEAGKVKLTHAPAGGAVTVKFGEPREKVTTTTGSDPVNAHPWPGHAAAGTSYTSEQQIIIYEGRAEAEDSILSSLQFDQLPEERQRLFVRLGDTIYFPGIVTHFSRYNRTTNEFVGSGPGADAAVEPKGAILLTVSPGLPFNPGTIYVEDGQNPPFGSIGKITTANDTPEIIIKEITVRRRRKRHLVG